ncbi:sulfite exporter TauE/SafE family protein [Sulfitobacter sp. HNIBRBA3233]|uniref:sulfite exporter TauE/SafE family protein n=1 Tax=Sulfitobacter marinivivus TaxID=3158558 RepID=UPI0032DFB004
MDAISPLISTADLIFALMVALVAGFVKGVVGFAMPLVFVSGLTMIMAPDLALAGLILPTLVSNGQQALRQGPRAAIESTLRFRTFLIAGGLALLVSAQFVRILPAQVMLLVIGGPVTFFALLQLVGWRPKLARRSRPLEAAVGGVAGALGGVSGIWGPPTVLYLTALDTAKHDQMRVQGVIYGLGAVALVIAHAVSGVLRMETLWFSAALVVPAGIGMWVGGRIMDRIDQTVFRRLTLLVLTIAGLNLLRRAIWG